MIAGVITVLNEADIIGFTLRHMLDQGMDKLWIADGPSTDGTRDAIRDVRNEAPDQVELWDDNFHDHRQQWWTDKLAGMAMEAGATWAIPFDADEIWHTVSGETIAEVLSSVPERVQKLSAQLWHYRDMDYRYAQPERLPKVAYRPHSDARVAPGAHNVSLPGDPEGVTGVLEICHLQYRSEEQFVRKVRQRIATQSAESRARGDGAHHLVLEHMTDEELGVEYRRKCAEPVVFDPVNLYSRVAP